MYISLYNFFYSKLLSQSLSIYINNLKYIIHNVLCKSYEYINVKHYLKLKKKTVEKYITINNIIMYVIHV